MNAFAASGSTWRMRAHCSRRVVSRALVAIATAERVETDRRVGGHLSGCFGVWGAEVHRDRLQLGDLVTAELFEERLQGDSPTIFGTPDHLAGVVVDDEGQIFVAAFPGDLIDTDPDQAFDP
nr:hypothetical protein [Candidatus Microthrix sp.]